MATETISLTETRPRRSELVERAHGRFDRFVITRRGRADERKGSGSPTSGARSSPYPRASPCRSCSISAAVGKAGGCRTSSSWGRRLTPSLISGGSHWRTSTPESGLICLDELITTASQHDLTRIGEAMTFAAEVSATVSEIVGRPTGLVTATTGDRARILWVG